jgi:hypothetical protein
MTAEITHMAVIPGRRERNPESRVAKNEIILSANSSPARLWIPGSAARPRNDADQAKPACHTVASSKAR